MSGLGWLIRDYLDTRAGRITWCNFLYLFIPAPARKQRLRNWKHEEWETRTDADGREYSSFKGRGAHCSNPTLWSGIYPRIEHKGQTHYIVPVTDCKACQFHEHDRHRRKFACCLLDRERLKSSPTPQQMTGDNGRL
jgi:hypothetical protein